MKRVRLLSFAILSAALLALCLPNELYLWGLPVAGFVAFAPLFFAVYRAKDVGEAYLLGFVFGFTNSLLSNYWLYNYGDFKFITLIPACLGVAVIATLGAGFLHSARRLPASLRALIAAVIWTGYEYLKSIGFLGFPWGLSAYALQGALPFVQSVDVLGVAGMSFFMALFNAAVVEAVTCKLRFVKIKYIGCLIVSLATLHLLYGTLRLNQKETPIGEIKVTLIQQNTPNDADPITQMRGYMRLADAALRTGFKPDVIVSGEGILSAPYDPNDHFYRTFPSEEPFYNFLKRTNTYNLVGMPTMGQATTQNGIMLIAPDATPLGTYGKRQLIPFAEGIPFTEFTLVRKFLRKVANISSGWEPGAGPVIFTIPTASGVPVKFGGPICFEDAFPAIAAEFVREGANIFINMTNDAWSDAKSAEMQHLVAARWRSIETRRPMVRATNGGMTSLIDVKGRITHIVAPFTETYLNVITPVYAESNSFYVIAGDWFARLCVGFSFAWIIFLFIVERFFSDKNDLRAWLEQDRME